MIRGAPGATKCVKLVCRQLEYKEPVDIRTPSASMNTDKLMTQSIMVKGDKAQRINAGLHLADGLVSCTKADILGTGASSSVHGGLRAYCETETQNVISGYTANLRGLEHP